MRAITRTVKRKPIRRYPKRLQPMIEGRREAAQAHWIDVHARAITYVMNAAEKGIAVSPNKMAKDLKISRESAERLLEKFEKDFSFKRTPDANSRPKDINGRFAPISKKMEGRILSFAKHNLKLTPTEIARKFRVSRQTVERLVVGKYKIRPSKSRLEELRLEGVKLALEWHIRRYSGKIYSLSWIARTFGVDKAKTAKKILFEIADKLEKEGISVQTTLK